MESTNEQRECFVLWVRHGERADNLYIQNLFCRQNTGIEYKFDPPLTQKGKQQAQFAGQRIKEYIRDGGYQEAKAKIISSPMLRTLQTAAYLANGLFENNTSEIITNSQLCVKLKPGLKQDPLKKGTYKQKEQELISKYLDGMIKNIQQDELMNLSNPSFPEDNEVFNDRYLKGFKEIINNHFILDAEQSKKQVLILVSHHKAINLLLKMYNKKLRYNGPSYCATLGFRVVPDENSKDGFKITHTKVFYK
ncbi:phosphoglycerate mutase family protein [Stylonychia lemnae]|uniref:Phosphoglycerate mutase family protein n=1 Tax=Stylonychia lemnae TaxID=5949 RepID=A0A078B582_STYLE|nr:phosphoglycerate mutase family protein [Stylonychia lemnae]|eukprot:CDW89685.1 phosphoglycerate mutase family protein [Stylonychia lemnae]